MAVTIQIDIRGDKELVAKLYQVDATIRKTVVAGGMQDAVRYVAQNAAVYPPTTEANSPPPPYYIRGTGTQYASYNRRESEQLNLHWDTRVNQHHGATVGVVENKVSYAPWVHSVVRQSWFHKMRNWRNIERIKQDVEQGVVKIFKDGVTRALSLLK